MADIVHQFEAKSEGEEQQEDLHADDPALASPVDGHVTDDVMNAKKPKPLSRRAGRGKQRDNELSSRTKLTKPQNTEVASRKRRRIVDAADDESEQPPTSRRRTSSRSEIGLRTKISAQGKRKRSGETAKIGEKEEKEEKEGKEDIEEGEKEKKTVSQLGHGGRKKIAQSNPLKRATSKRYSKRLRKQ